MSEEKKYSVEKIRRYFKGKYSWTSIDKLIKKMYLDGEINWEKTKGLDETDARKVIEKISQLKLLKNFRIVHGGKYIKIPEDSISKSNNGYIFEHRYVMEKEIGRSLTMNECIVHINDDKMDNRIENLILCKTASEAQKIHQSFKNLKGELVAMGVIGFNFKTRKFEILDRDK